MWHTFDLTPFSYPHVGKVSAFVADVRFNCSYKLGPVSISTDGTTIIVGGPNDNYLLGAAWVYTRNGPSNTLVGPADLFMGVTNSDNNGRKIDIKLEIFRNSVADSNKLVEGTLPSQQVAGNALNNSKDFKIDLSALPNLSFANTDILIARVSVRRVGGSGDFGVRFWYNSDSTTSKSTGWSRMKVINGQGSTTSFLYFLANSVLGTAPNHMGIASVLTATTAYQSFGTWSTQGSLMMPEVSTRQMPSDFSLEQNYPNPFNPSTTIRYGLPTKSQVSVIVYNTLGQMVSQLVSSEQESGYHEVRFDASGLSSGVYFYRLSAGTYVETRKLLLVR